MTGSVNSQRL